MRLRSFLSVVCLVFGSGRYTEATSLLQHKTIESVLQRGEKINDLVDRSTALSAQSKMFYKTAKKVSPGALRVRSLVQFIPPPAKLLLCYYVKQRCLLRAASCRHTLRRSRPVTVRRFKFQLHIMSGRASAVYCFSVELCLSPVVVRSRPDWPAGYIPIYSRTSDISRGHGRPCCPPEVHWTASSHT